MTQKWFLCAVAVLYCLAGCKSSNQTTPQSSSNANQSSANAGADNQAQQQPTPESSPEAPTQIVVPAGTSIPVILSTRVSASADQGGTEFEGTVAAPIIVEAEKVIPKGAAVAGTVVSAKKQGAVKGEGSLSVQLTSLQVGGREYPISTSTYTVSAKGKGKRTAAITGGGAALGALIGGLAGHGKGAVIGAAAGGGGGLAASAATGGQKVEIPAETRITFKLTEDVTIQR